MTIRGRAAVLAGIGVLTLSACGNGGAASTTTNAGSTSASCAQTAKERADAARAPKPFNPPSDPVNMSALAGKSVWIIAPTLAIPFNAQQAKGADEAAKAAGLKSTVFDGKGTVTTQNQGVAEAVAQHADGIILQGVDPQKVSEPLARAKALGIPVVDSFNGSPDAPLVSPIVAHVTADYKLSGREIADWILADSSCKADTVAFTASIFSVLVDMMNGFNSEYQSLCPSCKVRTEDVDLTKMDTQLGSLTQSDIRRDPGVNYLFPTFDAMVTFVLPAVEQQAGGKVKIVSHDGIDVNLDYIRQGKQHADGAQPSLDFIGWADFDQVARAMLKQKVTGYPIPDRIIDSTNIPSDNGQLFPAFGDFRTTYRKLWGI